MSLSNRLQVIQPPTNKRYSQNKWKKKRKEKKEKKVNLADYLRFSFSYRSIPSCLPFLISSSET